MLGELKEAKTPFEQAWDAWDCDGDATVDAYRVARDAWVDLVIGRVFGWGPHHVKDAPVEVVSPNGRVTVHSTGAFRRNQTTAALTWVIDPVRSLHDLLDDGWATSPIDRMEMMLRAAGVPIGIVTDGRWWAIVSAPPKTMVASGVVDSQTWVEESDTRDAFAALLAPNRLAGGKDTDRLPAMFVDSVAAAEEITESLGSQVRRAVELLVQSFSESAEEAHRRGDPDPLPDDGDLIYSAAVTVMMRVVFLLFAEERDLLPRGPTLRAGLRTGRATRRTAPARRGRVTRSPGRHHCRVASPARDLPGAVPRRHLRRHATARLRRLPLRPDPIPVPERPDRPRHPRDHRQRPRHDARARRRADGRRSRGEARPISFRDIDVEQIGYIYEGLLGYTCRFADETDRRPHRQGRRRTRDSAARARRHRRRSTTTDKAIADAILAWVKTDQPAAAAPTASALTKALAAGDGMLDADLAIRAVTHDPDLAEELKGWIGVIRRDLRDRPTVVKAGGLLVVETPSRRNAGAHYTPRSLAEEVVLHALEPLVYAPGPVPDAQPRGVAAEVTRGDPRPQGCRHRLRLRCVPRGRRPLPRCAPCRSLERGRESRWEADTSKRPTPSAQVVAHCLYGADINPMAIEMCKLSLWLVSLDPKLPFSFVDDKVLVGNSLLGVTDLAQLEAMHIDPSRVPQKQALFDVTSAGYGSTLDVHGTISKAIRLRQALASEVDNDDPQRSTRAKQGQLKRLRDLTAQLRDIADGVIAAGLRLGGKPGRALDEAYDNLRIAVNDAYPSHGTPTRAMLDSILDAGLTPTVETDYERWQPLHWAIELPDVFERGGFDAIIGNPPFLGGSKITGAMGTPSTRLVRQRRSLRAGAATLTWWPTSFCVPPRSCRRRARSA